MTASTIFSASSNDGSRGSLTAGFYKMFSEKEIVVRKWDPSMETFGSEIEDSDELNRFAENKKDLDRYCGAYPYERSAFTIPESAL